MAQIIKLSHVPKQIRTPGKAMSIFKRLLTLPLMGVLSVCLLMASVMAAAGGVVAAWVTSLSDGRAPVNFTISIPPET